MRIPESVTNRSKVRISIQVDGSFNDAIELTGTQLKKLAGLLGGVPTAADIVPKMVAGDAAAERREDTPLVKVERRGDAVVQVPAKLEGNVSTPQPETVSTPQPETGTALPDVTPDLGE